MENRSGVLLNDGGGRFRDSGQVLPVARYGHVGAGDLNGDGSVDVVLQGGGVPAQVWVNDGTGRLIDTGIRLGYEGRGWDHCAVVDVDGDGDQDIFLTDRLAGQHGLWLNQLMEREDSLSRY